MIAALLLAGCTASPSPAGSVTESLAPSQDEDPGALSFCDAGSEISLRAPDGSRVEIQGPYRHVDYPYPADIVTVLARRTGDCVWLVETISFPDAPGEIAWIREFHGRLGTNFRIAGEFAKVFGSYPGDRWQYGPITFRVEIVDGVVHLVEDREPSVPAPGCTGLPGTCPDPLQLVHAD